MKPSVSQIKQRINLYEANIEKPKSVLMLAEGLIANQKKTLEEQKQNAADQKKKIQDEEEFK